MEQGISSSLGHLCIHHEEEKKRTREKSTTEGFFVQEIDDLPYVIPNYEKFLFLLIARGSI
jgi:hypothetical protein